MSITQHADLDSTDCRITKSSLKVSLQIIWDQLVVF